MFATRVAAQGALIGVVAAVPVATLMGWQGMLLVGGVGVASWVSFLGYGAASGVTIGVVIAHRPSGDFAR
jgi:hypothetical protein